MPLFSPVLEQQRRRCVAAVRLQERRGGTLPRPEGAKGGAGAGGGPIAEREPHGAQAGAELFAPAFNTMYMFKPGNVSHHMVSPVVSGEGKRFAVSGCFTAQPV
mmetsp:Transcript_48379/g.122764  ORF Transcript_48379/g.122764 Transcript_48379/m.122764 type:complete len:104 (-) Transcript_48379:28-339(-)